MPGMHRFFCHGARLLTNAAGDALMLIHLGPRLQPRQQRRKLDDQALFHSAAEHIEVRLTEMLRRLCDSHHARRGQNTDVIRIAGADPRRCGSRKF